MQVRVWLLYCTLKWLGFFLRRVPATEEHFPWTKQGLKNKSIFFYYCTHAQKLWGFSTKLNTGKRKSFRMTKNHYFFFLVCDLRQWLTSVFISSHVVLLNFGGPLLITTYKNSLTNLSNSFSAYCSVLCCLPLSICVSTFVLIIILVMCCQHFNKYLPQKCFFVLWTKCCTLVHRKGGRMGEEKM